MAPLRMVLSNASDDQIENAKLITRHVGLIVHICIGQAYFHNIG